MKPWKTHLLKLRKENNGNNAIIQRRFFTRKDGSYVINPDLDERMLYDEYRRVCKVTIESVITDPMYPQTQSEMLRKNIKQARVKNTESKTQDSLLRYAVSEVIKDLEEKFPNETFGLDKMLSTKFLEKMVDGKTGIKGSHIRPDGGFVWIMINSKKYYILVSEQKRQGTNDKRLAEGLDIQGVGNAFERLPNYLIGCDILFKDDEVYPFIAWLQGCDFREESSIPARVNMLFSFQEANMLHLDRKKLGINLTSGGSYFMRGNELHEPSGSSDWTAEEMIPIMCELAEHATKYYIKKYGE